MFNEIGDDGAQHIFIGLAQNKVVSLQKLNLYQNKIGDNGVRYLDEALQQNEVAYYVNSFISIKYCYCSFFFIDTYGTRHVSKQHWKKRQRIYW